MAVTRSARRAAAGGKPQPAATKSPVSFKKEAKVSTSFSSPKKGTPTKTKASMIRTTTLAARVKADPQTLRPVSRTKARAF